MLKRDIHNYPFYPLYRMIAIARLSTEQLILPMPIMSGEPFHYISPILLRDVKREQFRLLVDEPIAEAVAKGRQRGIWNVKAEWIKITQSWLITA